MKHGLTLGAIALTLVLPVAANAAMIKGQDGRSVTVDATVYNLRSETGQEMLYRDLKQAASSVCGTVNLRRAGSLERALQNRECVRGALDRAVDDVGNAGIRAIHEQS